MKKESYETLEDLRVLWDKAGENEKLAIFAFALGLLAGNEKAKSSPEKPKESK